MSAYDDAVVYLYAEVHPRCDYDIYSDMRDIVDEMEAENAKLREDMEDLEGYDQMLRDRLRQETELRVKAEAENAKLRKRLVQYELFEGVIGDPSTEFARLRRELHRLQRENAKLRELILDMLVDEERGHNDDYTYYEHVRLAKELGIEVE